MRSLVDGEGRSAFGGDWVFWLLFRGEMTHEETGGEFLLRIKCKVDKAGLDLLERKISNCMQYDKF